MVANAIRDRTHDRSHTVDVVQPLRAKRMRRRTTDI